MPSAAWEDQMTSSFTNLSPMKRKTHIYRIGRHCHLALWCHLNPSWSHQFFSTPKCSITYSCAFNSRRFFPFLRGEPYLEEYSGSLIDLNWFLFSQHLLKLCLAGWKIRRAFWMFSFFRVFIRVYQHMVLTICNKPLWLTIFSNLWIGFILLVRSSTNSYSVVVKRCLPALIISPYIFWI